MRRSISTTDPAFQLIQKDQLLQLATRNLINREWFERLWVRQEIRLARRAAIFCGRFEVDWEDFRSAMVLAVPPSDKERRLTNRVGFFFVPHDIGWHNVRFALLGLKCSDLRDRIYGLLALIDDDGADPLPVDYKLSTAEVYTSAARHCLGNMTRRKNILVFCELSSNRMANLPSWVPDWSTDPKFTPVTGGRLFAVGTRPFIEFPEHRVMRLAGVLSSRVKTVVSLGRTPDELTEGVICALSALSSPHDDYTGGKMLVGEALICAMLFGHYRHTERPPNRSYLSEDEARGALRYFVVLSKGGDATEQDTGHYKSLLRQVEKWPLVPQNNSVILFEDGLIGTAPGVAAPGDRLFFPLGSHVPLLVRRAVGSQAPRWLVVCAAWVTGRMAGEILYGPLPSNYDVVVTVREDSTYGTRTSIERLRDGPGECSTDEAWSPRERPRRFGVDNERDLTPELLTSKGVPVEWLEFV